MMCAYGVARGTNTVGDFVLVNAMMIQLYQPLNFMGMVYREIKQAMIDIETMFDCWRKPEIEDKPGAQPLRVDGGAIRFENVSFATIPTARSSRASASRCRPGRRVAIVGPSGAGKSTISRLLFRFYDLMRGRILIDGQDIRDVTQSSLRARHRHGAAGHRAVQRHDRATISATAAGLRATPRSRRRRALPRSTRFIRIAARRL